MFAERGGHGFHADWTRAAAGARGGRPPERARAADVAPVVGGGLCRPVPAQFHHRAADGVADRPRGLRRRKSRRFRMVAPRRPPVDLRAPPPPPRSGLGGIGLGRTGRVRLRRRCGRPQPVHVQLFEARRARGFAVRGFRGYVGVYVELCVGWCFIYLVISGAERLARIEEEVSALRVVAYDSQSELFRNEFRLDFIRSTFAELDGLLSLRRQPESQDVVFAVAAKLRGALDRWPDAAGRADRPEANAGEAAWGDADSSAPDLVVRAVMNLNIANIIFWIANICVFCCRDGAVLLW